MLLKVQVLQKRLIGKAAESVDKASALALKDRLYAELKHILARQPGPEIAEQLAVYRSSLREKDLQSDQMSSELAMHHAQVTEYRSEIERVTRELHEVKVRFYEQKRKEQAHKERSRMVRTKTLEATVADARASLPRFTGGGFSLQRH
ncbi:flagellar associated protein-like protein [Pavlovales sp. CCMP2436]|nr:flagellar associated protein-like protein [Pavlovales sp. CCMP2436]